jgi:hypothetical protein
MISKHFSVEDVQYNEMALRLKINNTLPESLYDKAIALAENILEPTLEKFPNLHITSWYRCENLEREYCKQDYVQWCFFTNHPVTESSWAIYLSKKRHVTAQAVTLYEVPGLYDFLKTLEFTHIHRKHRWISISYDSENLAKRIADES